MAILFHENCHVSTRHGCCFTNLAIVPYIFRNAKFEAKSRKYQGVFKMIIRIKTWPVRGIWSQQLEHKQVSKKKDGNQVSGRVSAPY